MTEEADRHRELLEASLENALVTRDNAGCDATYTNEYKRFVLWVLDDPRLETQQPPFIRPHTVDAYYTKVVSKMTTSKGCVNRVANALQHYYSKVEIVDRLEHQLEHGTQYEPLGNLRDRPLVQNALAHQELVHGPQGTAKPGTDPHKGLKDIISRRELLRAVDYIYRDKEWGPLSLHFLYGQNGAIRGASNRNLKYCDLKHSGSFAPEEGQGALLVIIRKGNVHKDRHEQDKQVAYWRHKHYQLCSVFSTAAYMIWNLSKNNDINFCHLVTTERAPWWDIPLTDWKNYSGK